MPEARAYPPDWQSKALGALADYINGYPFKPRDWTTVGTPIVRIAQMTDPTAAFDCYAYPLPQNYRINSGDLLFSWSATLLALIWRRGPAYLNQHIYKVVAKNGNDTGFLHHLLNWLIEPLASQSHGTTMKHVTRGDFLPFPVTVPSPLEQTRIAAVLDTVDEAIAKTKTVIAKLRQVRTGLLHDLLTRGLDEHGQLRDPIADPEQFQDSPLGRIPRAWAAIMLEALCSYIGSGVTPRGGQDVYTSEGVVFIRSQNVTFDGLLLDDVAYIPDEIHRGMLRSEAFPHDVLFNITGASIGRCCPMPAGLGTANVNQHVCILRAPAARASDAAFLAAVLASPIGQRQLDALNTMGNRQGINYQQLGLFVVPWPDEQEREAITHALAGADAQRRAEEHEKEKLTLLKSGLMTDLLTGRVRVPESRLPVETPA